MPARKITVSSSPATVAPTPSLSLTNSSITDFLSCRRRFKLKYEDKLSYKSIPTALIIGDLVHQGLAELMLGKPLEASLAKVRAAVAAARKLNMEDAEDFESDVTIVEGMIRGFDMRRGLLKNASVWDFGGSPWVEKSFIWLLPDGTQITGKVDAVVVQPEGLFLVEHKTAGRIDAAYINRLQIDSQVTMYTWALSKIYGKPIVGTIYNAIKKPAIRQKKTESLVQFQTRLLEELTTVDGYFFQCKLYRDPDAIQAFEKGLGWIADDVRLERVRNGWPLNTSQCAQIGRTCSMLPLCSNPRSKEVRALYETRAALHPELS